ncbi:unnamed protein product [Allacma fusca]|uniref:Uncharacterized protein n=1 Tax=Allacma fusca TaxID=39272 RepID=A0A8J2MGR6_9HEXA|nr:unnamed protein product [Allacma fusca]
MGTFYKAFREFLFPLTITLVLTKFPSSFSAVISNANEKEYGNAYNPDNPFIYPVPFTVFLLLQSPLFNRTHESFAEPYDNITREEINGYFYHRAHDCGVHFMNEREGLIISHDQIDNETESDARCTWGFVGNRFCTPSIHCLEFQPKGDCRTDYLQVTDSGESFSYHYCDNSSTPLNKEITAPRGILDVTYRYSGSPNLEFECYVKCAQYSANVSQNVIGNRFENDVKTKQVTPSTPVRTEVNFPKVNVTQNCGCGTPNGYKYRVVGGRETTVGQYPWMVGILNDGRVLPFCGGSLINDRYVLTAAHCMEDESPEDVYVILNEHDFGSKNETVGTTIRRSVAEIIPYHYYLDATFYGDMALLRLNESVDISNFTLTPVCLPPEESNLFEGKDVVGAGWGTLKEGGKKSPTLQEVIMRVMSNSACNDYHTLDSKFPVQVTDNMLCAGYSEGGKDTCAGDSGGPLIAWEKKRFTQVGVTSWGFGCGNRLNPGVFTRVTSFLYWIRANTLDATWCAS